MGGTPHYSGAVGGFGGGGATHINSWEQGGGGGGYSGGAAARGPTAEEGAGGGSLNGGSDQSIEVNANNDHGKVVIYLSENSNHPPTDLNTIAPLTIAENQQVGTVVGQFNATDPEGEAITYSLINGGVDNHYFSLSSNGLLTLNGSLDYETDLSDSFRSPAAGRFKYESRF